jgi:hypothetical protein
MRCPLEGIDPSSKFIAYWLLYESQELYLLRSVKDVLCKEDFASSKQGKDGVERSKNILTLWPNKGWLLLISLMIRKLTKHCISDYTFQQLANDIKKTLSKVKIL